MKNPDWATRRIRELGRVVTGKTPPTKDHENFGGPYPFITIPDLDGRVRIDCTARTLSEKGADKVKSSLLPAGAVLMSCIATIGKCGVTSKPSFTNQQINSVIPGVETDSTFLYYAFTQLAHQLDSAGGGGSVFTNVSKSRFSDIEIPIPSLPEQRAIAHILSTLDDKIELNRRMNQTLEEMARALFKSWFVDFDPVRAKMDGRWCRGHSLPGMPAELYDLFPDRMVSSKLGEIPEGWEVKELGELFVAKNVRVGNDDVPEYSCTNEGVIPRSERFKKRLSLSKAKNKVISKGDFVFGLSRRILNFGLMRSDIGCVSPAYRTYSTNYDLVIPDLLERIMRLQSEYFYLAVSSSSREGQSISQEFLYGLQVTLPAIAIQKLLYQIIERISLRVELALMENRKLGSLRDVLLPKLISGEVKTP